MKPARQVVLDTETTGLEVEEHRIIEIGCVELRNRRRTDSVFHHYLNPEREIEEGAYEVHGISRADLADKPLFADIARDLLDFLKGSEVIMHNAAFDEQFIDRELARLGPEWGRLRDHCSILDTLALARELHPGQKNSLDALCARYAVDNSTRELHGALLDARILSDVYLAMTGGQAALLLEEETAAAPGTSWAHRLLPAEREPLRVIRPTAEELAAHRERLEALDAMSGGRCLWRKREESAP
jgi:DNA polymerase-3 subunit epsilon